MRILQSRTLNKGFLKQENKDKKKSLFPIHSIISSDLQLQELY